MCCLNLQHTFVTLLILIMNIIAGFVTEEAMMYSITNMVVLVVEEMNSIVIKR